MGRFPAGGEIFCRTPHGRCRKLSSAFSPSAPDAACASCDAYTAPLVSVRVLKTAGVCSGSALRVFVSEMTRFPS